MWSKLSAGRNSSNKNPDIEEEQNVFVEYLQNKTHLQLTVLFYSFPSNYTNLMIYYVIQKKVKKSYDSARIHNKSINKYFFLFCYQLHGVGDLGVA